MPDGLHSGHVVPGISIENLLAHRDGILKRFADAMKLIEEAREIALVAKIVDPERHSHFERLINGRDSNYRADTALTDGEKGFAAMTKRVDAMAWDNLMKDSGLMTFMDAATRKKWADSIDKCDTPALTKENIVATFRQLYGSREQMFEDGVLTVFRKLSWNYKTNQPFAFGKRIILYVRQYGHFSHERVNDLEDLQRVFCVLDGKPEDDHRRAFYHRLSSAGHLQSRGVHDDVYMHVRWFKNNNGHITFKRPDLVDKLNQIIAKRFPNAIPHDIHATETV